MGRFRRNRSPYGVVENPPGAVGIPYEARSGKPLSGEPAVAEGSSQSTCGTGHAVPCSSPITSCGDAAVSGLQSGYTEREPRRRERLPLAAMSEGAHRRISIASLRLRLNDERRPGFRVAAGPARADEGGGPDAGAANCGKKFKPGHYRRVRRSS